MPTYKIESAARTFVGRRNNNEDSFCSDTSLGLFAVADGMGGYEGGEVASHLAIETMLGFFRRQGERARHKGFIWGVYVAPEGRGLGLARRLMNECIERARRMDGLEEVILTVSTTQDVAMKLYESMGFKEYGHEVQALKQGDIYIDEKMMGLRL